MSLSSAWRNLDYQFWNWTFWVQQVVKVTFVVISNFGAFFCQRWTHRLPAEVFCTLDLSVTPLLFLMQFGWQSDAADIDFPKKKVSSFGQHTANGVGKFTLDPVEGHLNVRGLLEVHLFLQHYQNRIDFYLTVKAQSRMNSRQLSARQKQLANPETSWWCYRQASYLRLWRSFLQILLQLWKKCL